MKTAMQDFIEWLENSSDIQNEILDWKLVKWNAIKKEEEQIKDLVYFKDTTIGLWATDKPELIPENIKHLFFQIK